MNRSILYIALLSLTGCVTQAPRNDRDAGRVGDCQIKPSDRAWLDASVRGWVATRRLVLEAAAPAAQDAVVFDHDCEIRSGVAMLTGESRWDSAPIVDGKVRVGDQEIPVGVVSATIGDDDGVRFAMSTPSVWAKARVPSGVLGLETLMSAVLVHEATHVFQMGTYGAQIDDLQKTYRLSDDKFNDDAIQSRFKNDPVFSQSISEEVRLLFEAAGAADRAQAVRLARTARALMRVRANRYYLGDQAYQRRAEDLWLTLEGSAQWAGLQWLMLPQAQDGAGASEDRAMTGFGKRGNSWTQLQGLGIFLALDRIAPDDDWKKRIFGSGDRTALQLLDEAIDVRSGVDAGRASDSR